MVPGLDQGAGFTMDTGIVGEGVKEEHDDFDRCDGDSPQVATSIRKLGSQESSNAIVTYGSHAPV